MAWQTRRMAAVHDVRAPDGSEIRLLAQVAGGSMVHCSLQPGEVTRAVRHRTVDELWFCVAGAGQVWRRALDAGQPEAAVDVKPEVAQPEEVVDVKPGVALTIPLGVAFQFRARGPGPLELVIATLPPWPGEDEAMPVSGLWEPTR